MDVDHAGRATRIRIQRGHLMPQRRSWMVNGRRHAETNDGKEEGQEANSVARSVRGLRATTRPFCSSDSIKRMYLYVIIKIHDTNRMRQSKPLQQWQGH
jgi:hypothetical protein